MLSSRIKDEVGNRYGRLVVVQYSRNDKHGEAIWLCQCDCGNTHTAKGHKLRLGTTASCGCIRSERAKALTFIGYGRAAFNEKKWQYANTARIRNLQFDLTDEQFETLVQSPCHYCGIDPCGNFRGFAFNGIDRVDNAVGYTPENCVTCCKHCNRAKSAMSEDNFKAWVRRVHAHWASKD